MLCILYVCNEVKRKMSQLFRTPPREDEATNTMPSSLEERRRQEEEHLQQALDASLHEQVTEPELVLMHTYDYVRGERN